MRVCIFCKKARSNIICKACFGPTTEIDPLFTNIILDLNEKGYVTSFCCSGHKESTLPAQSYIKFEPHVKLPKELPKNYVYEHGNIIRKTFKETKPERLEFEIYNNSRLVQVWVDSLPILENKEGKRKNA